MSLDIYLQGKEETKECICSECGHVHTKQSQEQLFTWNITHNLGKMAEAAELYDALWRPEDLNISKAGELIPVLEKGLEELEMFPDTYKGYNPENGWGDYKGLVKFVRAYLEACKLNPEAEIEVSR